MDYFKEVGDDVKYIPDIETNQRIDDSRAAIETARQRDELEEQAVEQEAVQTKQKEAEKTDEKIKDNFGYNDTRPNKETGKPEKVERSYSDNETLKGIQKTTDAIMDDPVLGSVAGLGAGVADTITDVIGLIPGLGFIDDAYDENFGRDRSKNDLTKFIRDASALIIPSLAGGWGIIAKGGTALKVASTAGKLGKASGLVSKVAQSKRAAAVATIAADMGVGTAIDTISDQSSDPGNLGSLVSDVFGVDIPWDSRKYDDPDVRKRVNILESAGLAGFAGVLTNGLTLFSRLGGKANDVQLKPADAASAKAVDKSQKATAKAIEEAGGDEGVAAQLAMKNSTEAAQTDEAVKRMVKADAEELATGKPPEYDAFVNEPAEPQARAVMNTSADPISFKADQARIANNVDTFDGQARPAVTDTFKNDLVDAPDGTTRGRLLSGLAKDLDARFEVIVGPQKLSADEVDAAVDGFVSAAMNMDVEEYTKSIDALKTQTDTILGNNVKVLSRDGFNVATRAFTKAFNMLDPKMIKASGVVAGQAGTDIAAISKGVDMIGDLVPTTRQQEMIWNNMKVLLPEIRASQYLDGWRLQADKFAKAVANGEDTQVFAKWMNETGEGFEATIKAEKEKALEFINTLEEVSQSNPEYFKPLLVQFSKTNGDVDSIYKLTKLMENRMGFWRKAFKDGNTQVPSMLVQELMSARYNNILTGLAPVRALGGAAMALAGKPITVFAGSAARGDFQSMKRASYVFGGIYENFQRAFSVAAQEWRHAVSNPRNLADRGGRIDLATKHMEDVEFMEGMAEAWHKNKEYGKVAVWNMIKVLSNFNDNAFVRFGINAMTSIDGFTKSMSASMMARARAYDEMFEAGGGSIDPKAFDLMQKNLYQSAFNKDGVLTDSAAKYAAGEMNLNLDNKVVAGLENFMQTFPVTKSIFMFPRTGANAMSLVQTFNPLGALGMHMGKSRKVFNAKTADQIAEVLADHGITEGGMEAFQMLKSEYKGRELMGASVTMGAAMLAFNGGLTGSGPQDAAERRRMESMGWKRYSIKNPLTGEWHSYQGFEPFDTFLGLTADVVFQGQRLDQAITEDWFRAINASISANVTSKTFLSGFEPLAGLISGDASSFNRWFAMQADSTLPGTGVRSMLAKAIVPQLKDVENNWWSYLANRNRWIPAVNAELVDMKDVYTGEPINYTDPRTAGVNALLPFFKTNPGMEEWRQKLLASGWDNLQTIRTDPNGEPITPEARNWINNWIADNYQLGARVEELFNQDDGFWMKEAKRYKSKLGLRGQNEMPVKETMLYNLLDDLHNDAFKMAWAAYSQENADLAHGMALKESAKGALSQNKFDKAKDLADELLEYGQR